MGADAMNLSAQVRRIYGSLLAPPALPEPLSGVQDELIHAVLLDPHFSAYPPAFVYQRSFWKHVVQRIESEGEVGSSSILATVNLMTCRRRR